LTDCFPAQFLSMGGRRMKGDAHVLLGLFWGGVEQRRRDIGGRKTERERGEKSRGRERARQRGRARRWRPRGRAPRWRRRPRELAHNVGGDLAS
jgi:hypothetical protein